MGMFSGMKEAPVYGAGRYITPGKWSLEIAELKAIESQRSGKGPFFCAEFVVLDSSIDGYQAGDRVSWMANAQHDSFSSNVKAFGLVVYDALGIDGDPDSFDEEAAEALVSADQPAKGARLTCEAWNVITRSGGDFTKVSWGTYHSPPSK